MRKGLFLIFPSLKTKAKNILDIYRYQSNNYSTSKTMNKIANSKPASVTA
jgi:hypothetical protein